jgi:ribosomal protein S18 acetylase RimI-like enzyme
MAQTEGGSIRIAKAADAAAIAIIHVESWRETYTGIVPDDVLAGLSVDQRTATWHRILCDPTTFYSSAVFVAERKGAIFGFACCGMQRSETLRAQGYDGEVSSIYILHSSQRQGFGSALMGAMAQELRRRQLHAASLWVLRENANARGFYERIGGEIVGEKEDIRQHGVFIEVAYGWHNLAELAELAARTAAHCTKLI